MVQEDGIFHKNVQPSLSNQTEKPCQNVSPLRVSSNRKSFTKAFIYVLLQTHTNTQSNIVKMWFQLKNVPTFNISHLSHLSHDIIKVLFIYCS